MSDNQPLPPSSTQPNDNPYIGPRTFTRDHAHLFFGRERESEELFSRVVSQRLVLFYAQSGAGKSSLINTQLIPKLEDAGFAVLPVARVGGDLLATLDEPVDNIYLFNLMLNLDQSQRNPALFAHLTLPDFLEHLTSEDGKKWVYEQDAGSNKAQAEEAERSTEAKNQAPTPNYVLIIDQFEEIIITHSERVHERADFFRQLEMAMVADPTLWVVLTLREDFVAALDPYAHWMTDKLRARYYMQRMGIDAARDAIRKPAEQFQRHFQPEAVEMLVSNLSQVRVAGKATTESGQFVEPVQLQVVCYQLWEKLKNRLAPLITTEDVRRAGDVDSALANFYETTLSAALQSHPLAGGERRLRNWFEKNLITEAGTRGTVYQGESETAGLPNELVLELANRFLLRSESRAGGRWIELTHDRFVEPIVGSNRSWELAQNHPLLAVTRLWLENGRDPKRLLRGQQLIDAQAFAKTHPELMMQNEQDFLESCLRYQNEQAEAARQAAIRRRSFLLVSIAVTCLFALLALWGFRSAADAKIAQLNAEKQNRKAVASELAAKSQASLASGLPQRSVLQAMEALTQTMGVGEVRLPAAESALRTAMTGFSQPAIVGNGGGWSVIATSSDNHWLATANSEESFIRLWDLMAVDPFQTPRLLLGHTDGVRTIAISADGKWLASGSDDNTVRLWDLHSVAPEQNSLILQKHADSVTQVVFSPDNHWLITASQDGEARLWNLTGKIEESSIALVKDVEIQFSNFSFSANGRWLVTTHYSIDGSWLNARLWDLQTLQSATPYVELKGHPSGVSQTAISEDSHWLATTGGYNRLTGMNDGSIRLWDLTDEQPGQSSIPISNSQSGRNFVFSPNSRSLIASDWQSLYVVDLQNDSPKTTSIPLPTQSNGIMWLRISPDNHWLVTSHQDGGIRLWDLSQSSLKEPSFILRGHNAFVSDAKFSQDGRWLITGDQAGIVIIWDLQSATVETSARVLRGHENSIGSMMITEDSHWLITTGGGDSTGRNVDGSVRVWDLSNQNETTTYGIYTSLNGLSALTPDNHWLITTQGEGNLLLWDMKRKATPNTPIQLAGSGRQISELSVSADSRWLVATRYGAQPLLWDLQNIANNSKPVPILLNTTGSIARFSPDNHWLAVGGDNGEISLWELSKNTFGSPAWSTRAHNIAIRNLQFSPDGRWLLTSVEPYPGSLTEPTSARLWDLAANEPQNSALPLQENVANENTAIHFAFSPDSHWLVTSPYDTHGNTNKQEGTIHVWDLTRPNPTESVIQLAAPLGIPNRSLLFTQDSHWLVTACSDGSIRLWDFSSSHPKKPAFVLDEQKSSISALAVSSDNRWLVAGGYDSMATLWDLSTKDTKPLSHRLRGHDEYIDSAVISADSHWLVTMGSDGITRLWNLWSSQPEETSVLLHNAAGYPTDYFNWASFSNDNRWLITNDGQDPLGSNPTRAVRLWALDFANLTNDACRLAGRNLTLDEWREAFGDLAYRKTCPQFPIHYSALDDARELAKTGEITAALQAAELVVDQDRALGVDPVQNAKRVIIKELRTQGRQLALTGEITKAVATYQEALRLAPTLPITPEFEAGRIYAPVVVKQATQLARRGEITAAVATYQEALRLDPTLTITPAVEANRNYAPTVVEQATQLASSGEITAAVAAYQEALRLDPTLLITPAVEANRNYAPTVVEQATQLASSGEIIAAVAAYQEALRLDPTLPITPEIEAGHIYAPKVVEQAVQLARSGEITASFAAISRAIQLDSNVEISGSSWNEICWNGALAGLAAQVMVACERAVAAAPENGGIRDSRALARALTGDIAGAIEDFEFFVKWAKQIGYDETIISSRQQYLAELKADKNPFTPEVLQQLHGQ